MSTTCLTGSEIRQLRQRLGWSLAEMARQMGCSTALITNWESGASVPEAESLNQLRFLQGHVDTVSEQVRRGPEAEFYMESERLSQLTHRDLLKDY